MGGKGSGGGGKVDIAEHYRRGTYKPARHNAKLEEPKLVEVLTALGRRHALKGLSPRARRVATDLLGSYGNWDWAAITSLRSYARSCARLEALEEADAPDLKEIRREVALNLSLLRALELGKDK